MAELATEHVRMLDAGRLRVAYSSPLTTSSFSSVVSRKMQLLQHGNVFGLSFVSTEKGFVMTKNDELGASCADYTKRRQEALDHGQKLTLEEIHTLPATKEVQLPSIAYWIALSPDEFTVAVAYGESVALFEVAHIVEATSPAPFHTFTKLQAQEIAWCTDTASERLAVLTVEKQVLVCTLAGGKEVIETQSNASSVSWSPSGEQIAVGLVDGTIGVYGRDTLQSLRSIGQPECCSDEGLEVHHVNWAEENLILVGYQTYDEGMEETTALACIYENDEFLELDEVVGFFDVENQRHQYFSAFLPDWRMFFIGCSLSADIELLVSDPDGGDWELWKPLEKYQARLPMNANDEESFPRGLALNLNSTSPVPVDEDAFPPVPIISCANTEGLLVNFGFVDTTVHDALDFVKSPLPFDKKPTRIAAVKEDPKEASASPAQSAIDKRAEVKTDNAAASTKRISHEYGQNDENEFAESDGESCDEEEERKEEEEKARNAFRSVASDGSAFIVSEQFPKLCKSLGATYDEEEHKSTLERLEKDGKVHEVDFIRWYVNWIFGDESDSDEDEDVPSSSVAKPAGMKSKEEIAAAFSKFAAKEGSWKCAECMVNNGPDAVKCSACEAPNPEAPKVVAPVSAVSATSAGSIGSGGFSFPAAVGGASKLSSFSFGVTPSASSGCGDPSNPAGLSFGDKAATTAFSFPSSTPGTGFSFPTTGSTKPATGLNAGVVASTSAGAPTTGFSFGDSSSVDVNVSASGESVTATDVSSVLPSSPKKIISHEYGQCDENEFAESDGQDSDKEEERKEEEDKASNAFRSVIPDGTEYITSDQFPELFKILGTTYDEEDHATKLKRLERDGKVYEGAFVSWYIDWILGSDSEEETDPVPAHKEISHEYGQNDENEFAESDGESCDEEEERKEEEEKARNAFRSVASDGSAFIVLEQFPKLFKTLGATYDEEEHKSTLERLEKDGKVHEVDFIRWYVNWIFGDESDSDEDEDVPSSSVAKPAGMKSKEEIAAAFSKFAAKEGSWKCAECMVNNGPDAVKCSACEAPNPEAPKVVAPVSAVSATSAGSIGSGGFSFPAAVGGASKLSSFSFGVTPSASSGCGDPSNPAGLSFGDKAATTAFSFPSSTPGTGFSFPTTGSTKPATGLSFGAAGSSTDSASTVVSSGYPPDTTSKPRPPAFDAVSGSGYPPDTTSKPKPPAFGATSGSGYPPDTTSKPKPPVFGAVSGSGYPPDTTSKPKPPAFGATSGSGYPPDTTSKPRPPVFGAVSGSGYPPDTTSKPKPPAFGATSGSGYPPDTTSKPKPPVFGAVSGSGYPPDTTSKPKPPAFGATSGSGYPPDTTSKPKPPVFGAVSGSGYPPDTTSKPKLPAFGATSGSGYPPDTTSKPKPPVFGAVSGSGYPPDTTSKPKPPAFGATSGSGYPPDTTSKPKPPVFGAVSGSGYPPDTTSKPKLPAFGATSGSGYPPDTTSKPKPPVFGAVSGSGYPPDTTSKPKLPAFGATSGSGYPPDTTSKSKPPAFDGTTTSNRSSSGYPPDTSTNPKPPMFGQSTASDKTASSFSFGSFGKNLFGSTPDSSASLDTSAQAGNWTSTTPTTTQSLFGSAFGASAAVEKAPDTSSSPFGVLPKAKSKRTFSFGAESEEGLSKTSISRPIFCFDGVSSTLDTTKKCDSFEDRPQTKRTLKFGDTSAFETKTNSISTSKTQKNPVAAPLKTGEDTPSSRMEGQLWKLIIDFDKSLRRVNESSKTISSKDPEFSKTLRAKMDKLRTQISILCDEINNLDESRDQIEKDVLFVIGSDGDVHEQLEYGREILHSFNDEALKRTLEVQPLDQRSKETRKSLKDKLSEVEKCCLELDSHLSSSKIGADCAVSSAHLFRVLKQTYDSSKVQYNKVCKLAEHLEKLSLRGNRMHLTNGVSGLSSVETEAHPVASKAEMMQMIIETEQRSQDVRRDFLSLCNNVVTPRDVFSAPRRKLAPPMPSDSSASPLRVKACSKLMPKTQLSVASPMSSAKQSSWSVSFKETPVKSGSKLFSLAEAMAPKEEPAKLVQTPQPVKPSVGVGKAPQRPSLGTPATEAKLSSTLPSSAPKSNVFSFPKSSTDSASSFAAPVTKEKTTLTSSQFSGFGVNSPSVKPKLKADANSTPAFSLGGKEAPVSSSAFSLGPNDSKTVAQQPTIASASTDYKALLEKFYKVYNPSKIGSGIIDKALATYKGMEGDLFTRLFTTYVPDSTPEDVKKYLIGGPVPPKSESATATSKRPAPANAASKTPFGGFGAAATTPKDTATNPSPFGASPSAFSLGPSANKPPGFGAFGSAAISSSTTPSATTASPFGKPAVNHLQKLVEFYQKYNPDKLSSVDATLQKYKGNEEKLFQNLYMKYKVNVASGVPPASPAMQPAKHNAAASPFGRPGAFSSPGTTSGVTFGSASSVGLGTAKPAPTASPFGAASQTSTGFGSAGASAFGGGFQSAAATTPSFGAPTPFGAAAGGFGASGVNYREKLTAFYQQHNPSKLSSVDTTLEKYKGREDRLFAMLEQKYVKKTPTASATGGFGGGIPSTTAFGGGSGFGAPSGLGAAGAPPAFGSASTLGGPAQPTFGANAGSGFGVTSQMGGGFGSAAPAAPTGRTAGSGGFGAFGSQTPTFGGTPQQSGGFGAASSGGFGEAVNSGGFGAAANIGGFGSGFGGGAASGGFGQPATFGNPSFTQMR